MREHAYSQSKELKLPIPPRDEQVQINLSQHSLSGAEHRVAKIEEKLSRLSEIRGTLVADLLLLPGNSPKHPHINRQLSRCDRKLEKLIAHHRPLFSLEAQAEKPLMAGARISYEQSLYSSLRSRFVRLGIDLGESQGRTIDQERYRRTMRMIQTLEQRVLSSCSSMLTHDLTIPAELRSNMKEQTLLQSALRAAVREGEKMGIDSRIAAESAAARLYRNIGGWKEYLPSWLTLYKPFHEVCSTLQNKSRVAIGYIKQSYREHTHRPLLADLLHAYGDKNSARINSLMGGDEIATAAHVLAHEISNCFIGKKERGSSTRQIYEKIPVKEMLRFETALASELRIPKPSLIDYLAGRLRPIDAQKIQALREGDSLREQTIHLKDLLGSTGAAQFGVRTVLRDLDEHERTLLAKRYQSEFGQSMQHAIQREMKESAAKDLSLAFLNNDAEKISAARLKCALDYREDWIGAPFLRTSASERDAMIAAYERHYHPDGKGNFWNDLRLASWRDDYYTLSHFPTLCRQLEKLWWPCTNSYPFLESLAHHGELKPSELLRYFMIGMGTDVRGIYAVLSNRTAAEIRAMADDYAQRYPPGIITRMLAHIPGIRNYALIGDLRHDLKVELSGDYDFDVSIFWQGLPDAGDEREICATMYQNLIKRYDHERGGLFLRNGFLSMAHGDRPILKTLEQDYRTAITYYREHIENQESISPNAIKRFCTLARIAEVQAHSYREAKVSLSTLVLNSGAFIGATLGATTALLIAPLSLWVTVPATICGSLSWRWLHGKLILGNGFGRNDATFQMIRAFVDGASLFTIRAGVSSLGSILGQQLSSGVAKSGFKTSLHRFVQSLEERISHQDKARNLLEKGALMASDEELNLIDQYFTATITDSPRALGIKSTPGLPTLSLEQLFGQRV